MNLNTNKTLVTGGSGLLGTAFKNLIPKAIFISSLDYDLTDRKRTLSCFTNFNPKYVIHLAGVSKSVIQSENNQAEIFYRNCLINLNVLETARTYNVEKLISIINYSAYPFKIGQFARTHLEVELHDGDVIKKDIGYGHSNRILDIQSTLYNKQYKTNFIRCISNNIYGPNDYFADNARVIPAIIHKTQQAIDNNENVVELHGISEIRRQFSYSEDVANMMLNLMENYNEQIPINVGNQISTTIGDISNYVKEEMNFSGEYSWDRDHQNIHNRGLDTRRQNTKFPNFRWKQIKQGIKETTQWFKKEKR